MFKNKTLKTIFIIFGVITIVAVTAGLLRGLRSDGGSEVKDSHTHDFEVISSVPGTCTTPGSETLKCKSCNKTETRVLEASHIYSENGFCKNCASSEEDLCLLVSNASVAEGVDEFYASSCIEGEICRIERPASPCKIFVLLNQGMENETVFYIDYTMEEGVTLPIGDHFSVYINEGKVFFYVTNATGIEVFETFSVYSSD